MFGTPGIPAITGDPYKWPQDTHQFPEDTASAQGQYGTSPRSHDWCVTSLAWAHSSLQPQRPVALLPCSTWGLGQSPMGHLSSDFRARVDSTSPWVCSSELLFALIPWIACQRLQVAPTSSHFLQHWCGRGHVAAGPGYISRPPLQFSGAHTWAFAREMCDACQLPISCFQGDSSLLAGNGDPGRLS